MQSRSFLENLNLFEWGKHEGAHSSRSSSRNTLHVLDMLPCLHRPVYIQSVGLLFVWKQALQSNATRTWGQDYIICCAWPWYSGKLVPVATEKNYSIQGHCCMVMFSRSQTG